MSFSIRQLKYFLIAAEAGNFSRAAIEANVTQSTITTAIKELETIMNTKLFERKTSGVELTREGVRFQQHALHIDTAIADALQVSRLDGESIKGRILLGVSYTVSGYLLPTLLSRFERTYPEVQVLPVETDRSDVEKRLINEKLDIAIILTSNIKDQRGLQLVPLISSPRQLWLSSNHKLTQYETVSLTEIVKERYIMLTVDEADKTTAAYWKEHNLKPATHFRTSSLESVRGFVATGTAVTILADIVSRRWSLDGYRLETRPITEDIPPLEIGVVWKRRRHLSAPEQAFINFAAAYRETMM